MHTISHPYTPSTTPSHWKNTLALWLLACSFFLTINATPCTASGPEYLSLQSFTVLTEQDQLIIRAPIDIEPREDMRHILRDGAQVLLTCTALLERERTLLPRSTVATSTASMVLSYDPLSRQYILSMPLPEELEQLENTGKLQSDEKNNTALNGAIVPDETPSLPQSQTQQTPPQAAPIYGHRDFNILMDATLGRLRMPLCSTSLLEEDENYFATIRVELRHTKVPPWLSQALFFWSWELVPSIEFTQALHGE